MVQNNPEYESLGLIYVGPEGSASVKANPSKKMGLCFIQTMTALRDRLLALVEDLRKTTPLERIPAISKASEANEWDMKAIGEELWDKTLTKIAD